MKFSQLILAAGIALAAHSASAATIFFDSTPGTADWDPIPNDYASQGLYGDGDGRVTVTYSGSSGTTDHLLFWNNDYGDLTGVAFTPTNGTNARINFTADPGYLINRIEFDMAGWANADLTATIVAMIGANSASWFNFTVQGDFNGLRHSHFGFSVTPNIASPLASIEWGTNWNVGIDNIELFLIADERQQIPEPASGVLALLGLGAMSLLRRRRA